MAYPPQFASHRGTTSGPLESGGQLWPSVPSAGPRGPERVTAAGRHCSFPSTETGEFEMKRAVLTSTQRPCEATRRENPRPGPSGMDADG